MKDLEPVVDIVQQRIKDGDTPTTLSAELLEKGYTQEQADWIFSKVALPEIGSKKSSNGFDITMIGLGIAAVILFAVTIPDYGFGEPRSIKDIEVPDLVDEDSSRIKKPGTITLSSGQTLAIYEIAHDEKVGYGGQPYDIDPYGIGIFGDRLGILFNTGLNVLMLDGEPERCHLRDRYSIKKILPTSDSYVLEVFDQAAERGHGERIFYGCDELGEQYIGVHDPVVVGGKVGYIGSRVVYPEDGWTHGTFNFDGKEYGSNIFSTENEFLLNNEIVFVGHSDFEQGKIYLYKGDELIFSSSKDAGIRGLHPFKVDGKLGYVLETTDKLEFVLDGEVIFEHRKVNIRENLFIDLKFSDTEGYIAMKKPNRVLYFSNGSYKFIDGIDDYVRQTDWQRPENNQTDGVVTFAVHKDGKTLIYRGDEVFYEIENLIRTNTITFSETGDFAYTLNKKLYLNGSPLEGQFEYEPVLFHTFEFEDSEFLFSTESIDTYAGETYSIQESFEDPRYYVNVYPYIIEGHPLFYVHKFGKRGEDVPTSHFLMYEENAPWAPTIEKTVANIKLLKE